APQADYPIQFDVEYPAGSSRILNFPLFIGLFIREILLIPHFIALFVLLIVFLVVSFLASFAILFTGAYPEGMYVFAAGFVRWWSPFTAYFLGLTDRYPPFSLSA